MYYRSNKLNKNEKFTIIGWIIEILFHAACNGRIVLAGIKWLDGRSPWPRFFSVMKL
jgi:hypothetical protein